MERLHDEVLAVGRGCEASDEARKVERGKFSGDGDEGEIGGAVVIEKGFVVGVGEQAVVGAGGGFFAPILLSHRTTGAARSKGRGAAAGWDMQDGQGGSVEPHQRCFEDGVEVQVRGEWTGDGGSGVGEPEFEAAFAEESQGDVAGVGGPRVVSDAHAGGQTGDAPLRRAGNGLQSEARIGERTARGIVGGIKADAGEPEFGLGEFGDGRSLGACEQEEVRAVGADTDGGRRGGVDERGECGGRLAVGRIRLRAERGCEYENKEERETGGDGGGHGWHVDGCGGEGHGERSRKRGGVG